MSVRLISRALALTPPTHRFVLLVEIMGLCAHGLAAIRGRGRTGP